MLQSKLFYRFTCKNKKNVAVGVIWIQCLKPLGPRAVGASQLGPHAQRLFFRNQHKKLQKNWKKRLLSRGGGGGGGRGAGLSSSAIVWNAKILEINIDIKWCLTNFTKNVDDYGCATQTLFMTPSKKREFFFKYPIDKDILRNANDICG